MLPNNWIRYGRTLYLKKYDALIVSDIHLGKCISNNCTISEKYDEKYNRLIKIIDEVNPETLILNGDVFYCSSDYFDNQLEEDNEALNFMAKLNKNVNDIIFLKGNHELVLGGFTERIKSLFTAKDYHIIDDILIQHGHDLAQPDENINHHIIGHVHPTVNGKPVFHHCKNAYNNCSVTILPAFCEYVDTVNINYYNGRCPILQNGISSENYTTKFV